MNLKPVEVYYWRIRGKGVFVKHFLAALDVPFNITHFDTPESYYKFKKELSVDFPLVNIPLIRDPNNENKYVFDIGFFSFFQ